MFRVIASAQRFHDQAVEALEEVEIMAMLFGGAYEGYQDGASEGAGRDPDDGSKGILTAVSDGLRAQALRVRAGKSRLRVVRMFWEGRALYRESCFADTESANEVLH